MPEKIGAHHSRVLLKLQYDEKSGGYIVMAT